MKDFKYSLEYGNSTRYIDHFMKIQDKIKSDLKNSPFIKCLWENKNQDCRKIFKYFVTEDGICYTFNSFHPSDIYRKESVLKEFTFGEEASRQWKLDIGYEEYNLETEVYPRRAIGSGVNSGLNTYLIDFINQNDALCRFNLDGFKVCF